MASSKGSRGPVKNCRAIVRRAGEEMRACHSKVLGDRIQRSKQDSGEDAGQVHCMAAFRLLAEGHSLYPRIPTSIHVAARLPRTTRQETESAGCLSEDWLGIKSCRGIHRTKNVRWKTVPPLRDGIERRPSGRNDKLINVCGKKKRKVS